MTIEKNVIESGPTRVDNTEEIPVNWPFPTYKGRVVPVPKYKKQTKQEFLNEQDYDSPF